MTEPFLISNPDDIDRNWLNSVLQHAEINAEVTDFTAKSIGTGQVGENVRFSLVGKGDLPASIVGKFPSPDPVSRQTGIDLNNYRREVHFYQNLQSKVRIQTPESLFSAIDHDTHDFVIVMEDLAPGEQGDQLAGCDVAAATLAVVELAHLHGPLWADTSIVDGDLVTEQNEQPGMIAELYNGVAPGFLARYNDRLTDEEKEMVSLVGDNLTAYGDFQGDRTLIHIDYRLDNMMFGGPYPLAVVDWQSFAFGSALNDLSYFMGTSIVPSERASIEEMLVRRYYDTLTAYDLSLSWETCWRDYRHHAPAGLIMAVIASMIVGETARGNDMFMAMAKRSAAMSIDLDAMAAITGR